MKLRLLVLPLFTLAANSPVALTREWTDVTGRHRIQAEFSGVIMGKVQLKKASGEIVSVPLERLSDADQEHVRSLARTVGNRKPSSLQDEPMRSEQPRPPKKPDRPEEADPSQNTSNQPTDRPVVAACSADDARTAVPPAGDFSMKRLNTFAFPMHLRDLAYSPDGKTLVVVTSEAGNLGGRGGAVELWDVASGRKRGVFLDASALVCCAAFSHDGKVLALGGERGLRLFHMENGQEMPDIKTPLTAAGFYRIQDMAFSPTENMLAYVSLDEVQWVMLDVSTGKLQRVFVGRPEGVSFSPDGRTIAMTDAQKGGIRLWSVADGRELEATAVSDGPSVAHPGPKRSFVAVGSKGNKWFIWDTSTNRAVGASLGPGMVVNLAVSPDGRWLVSHWIPPGNTSGLIRGGKADICIQDLATGKIMAKIPGPWSGTSPIAFSPDGRILAVGEAAETLRTMNLSFYSLYGDISPGSNTP